MTIENRTGVVMRQRGIKPRDLVQRTGISHNTALAMYRGVTTRIDLPVLDKVCSVLNVTPGELLVWKPNDKTGAAGQ
jgi:putative transcriptional regulator